MLSAELASVLSMAFFICGLLVGSFSSNKGWFLATFIAFSALLLVVGEPLFFAFFVVGVFIGYFIMQQLTKMNKRKHRKKTMTI